jgi:hypothetical protein
VVSPAAPLSAPIVEWVQETFQSKRSILKNDNEGWTGQEQSFQLLLSKLATRAFDTQGPPLRRKVVILSGDVHYSYAVRVQYWASKPYTSDPIGTQAIFAMLTASSFKNQEDSLTGSLFLHDYGYEVAGIINRRNRINYFGWENATKARTKVGTLMKVFFDRVTRTENVIEAPWSLQPKSPSVQCLESDINTAVGASLSQPPEWRYAVYYLDSSKIQTVQTQPINNNGKRAVAATHEYHRQYVLSQGAGKQIAGRNNIGEITFKFEDGDAQKARIGQMLWWRTSESVAASPLTFHIVSLEFADPEYPDPMTKVDP